MKKILIPVAAASIGAAAYLYQQYESRYNVLDYIPNDTALFAGTLAPQPLKDYLSLATNHTSPEEIEQLKSLYNKGVENDTPATQFLFSLLNEYYSRLDNPEQLLNTFGLGNKAQSFVYTLGLLPVIKLEVEEPQVLWDLLDKKEQETGFLHEQKQLKEITFRSYPLTPQNETTSIDLVIAQHNGFLTVTLNTEEISEATLAMALGMEKPSQSLADSSTLSNIVKQHKFSKTAVGFVNHIAIIDGITGADDSLLAKHLTTLMAQSKEHSLESLQTPVCQQEFHAIAENWPRTAFGYTDVNITPEKFDVSFSYIIENKNAVILEALKSLRGYVPDYTQQFEDNIFATSLAIKTDNISNAVSTILSDLQTPAYQCVPLASSQKTLSAVSQSIGMLGMATNMAAGVYGASTALFDINIEKDQNGESQLNNLDGLMAIHAYSPETLFSTIKMFVPQLQQTQLTNNGPEIDLTPLFNIDPVLNLDPKLAIKGKHIVLYNGQKGKQHANKIGAEKLSPNGVYQMSFNMKKLLIPLGDLSFSSSNVMSENMSFLTGHD